VKEEKAMMRTSHPGNDAGYVLLDAILSLFIAVLMLLAMYGGISTFMKYSARSLDKAILIIEERNNLALYTGVLGDGQ
jgi:hypothetical protein